MKQFEEKLHAVKIPVKYDMIFEKKLRNRLIKKYINKEKNYIWHYRIAAGIACLFALFTMLTVFAPDIPQKLNQLAFNDDQNEKELSEPLPGGNSILLDDVLQHASIENPAIAKEIDPSQYLEEKTYLIRRYVSHNQEKVTIVSEIEPDNQRRSSYHKKAY